MAMNTWQSRGAGRRRLTLGLGLVRIEVPSTDELGSLTDRLTFHSIETQDDGRTLEFDDPWANRILVRAAA
jgi:catechol 2,3-dioxygenase